MARKHMLSPLHPIHPRTEAEVKAGTWVVVRDAWGEFHDRIAISGVVRGADFLVVWVAREENAGTAQIGELTTIPWPAEDVWIPGEEPRPS